MPSTRRKTTKSKTGRKAPSPAVRRACFVEALRRTANVSRAAREAGLATSTVYRWRANIASFAQGWADATREALDELEASVHQRVKNGTERPVFYGGEQVGTVRNYSDRLAMFVLKAKRPEIYNRPVPAAAQAGEPLPIDLMTDDEAEAEFDRRIDRLRDKS